MSIQLHLNLYFMMLRIFVLGFIAKPLIHPFTAFFLVIAIPLVAIFVPVPSIDSGMTKGKNWLCSNFSCLTITFAPLVKLRGAIYLFSNRKRQQGQRWNRNAVFEKCSLVLLSNSGALSSVMHTKLYTGSLQFAGNPGKLVEQAVTWS